MYCSCVKPFSCKPESFFFSRYLLELVSLISIVADPYQFHADTNPAFHFDADPDPTTHFFKDLDPPMLLMIL